MSPIFRWNGRYFGFVSDGYLFDAFGFYRGWVTRQVHVWRAEGRYAGEVVDRWYVLYDPATTRPTDVPPQVAPDPPTIPLAWADRTPRQLPAGCADGLDAFGPG